MICNIAFVRSNRCFPIVQSTDLLADCSSFRVLAVEDIIVRLDKENVFRLDVGVRQLMLV